MGERKLGFIEWVVHRCSYVLFLMNSMRCEVCGGNGVVPYEYHRGAYPVQDIKPCPNCEGTGRV